MPHVVVGSCIRCKTTECVEVCPVDCFHEGPNMLVIHPWECIDCTVCVPECPVDAIYHEDDLPTEEHAWIERNAQLAEEWPVIAEPKDPPPDWEEWADVKDKLQYLEGAGSIV